MIELAHQFDRVLAKLNSQFTLFDVGASGSPPAIWQPIAPFANYVGFDPDLREIQTNVPSGYHSHVIINKAITSVPDVNSVKFFLTRSPFCSSTLPPQPALLSHYDYADFFEIVGELNVAATTLNDVMSQLHFTTIDWIKLDTQGTYLQILNSLSDTVFQRLLAVDLEPGLQKIYAGEDSFDQIQLSLLDRGFWLSNLVLEGARYVKPSTLSALPSPTAREFQARLRKSPVWVEVRYLRTIEWLTQIDANQRDYVALWTFSLLDRQNGFALDVASAYEERFGHDDVGPLLRSIALEMPFSPRRFLSQILPQPVKSWVRRVLS